METTRQLYQLQELDIAIDHQEQSLALKTGLLGNKVALDAVAQKNAAEQKRFEDLKRQRRDAESQVDDIAGKIKAAEKELYGGKVTNPKELGNLQHEINNLKSQSSAAQDKALSVIELVEAAEKTAAAANAGYKAAEEAWGREQKQLAVDIVQLKASLVELKEERAQQAAEIEPTAITLYNRLRQQKKQAVSRVEQGICRSCRISLSASALQRARSGQPVQCGSCGRILYIS
jgi:predicted  nucleic acid-binding Zn-ribbon protein